MDREELLAAVEELGTTVAVEDVQVLDLRNPTRLAAVGLTLQDLDAEDWQPCQNAGEAAAHLGFQGVVAPSATEVGEVLAVFEHRITLDQLIVLDSTEADWGGLSA